MNSDDDYVDIVKKMMIYVCVHRYKYVCVHRYKYVCVHYQFLSPY